MDPSGDESANPDWNQLHRDQYAARGRKVAVGLIALSVLMFAFVALVVVLVA